MTGPGADNDPLKLFAGDKGLFKDHCKEALGCLARDPQLLSSFQGLSEPLDRIKFIRAQKLSFVPASWDASGGFPKKDLGLALKFKEEGNDLFKANKFMEAADMYTKALQHCPFDSSDPSKNKDYSIILANRSAATDKAGFFEATVQDIDCALKYGYPKELHYKVHNRRGHALLRLKKFADSKKAFAKCVDTIGKSDMPTKMRDQWRVRMKKQMSVFGTVRNVVNDDSKAFSPLAKLVARNPENDGPTIRLDKRTVTTMLPVKAEDVVFREDPFAIVVLEKNRDRVCPVRMGPMVAPVPCSRGSSALFSSEEARAEAEATFQRYEWKTTPICRQSNVAPAVELALRILTTLGHEKVPKVFSALHQAEGLLVPEGGSTWPSEGPEAEIVALLRSSDQDAVSVPASLTVTFMVDCLRQAGFEADEGQTAFIAERALTVALKHYQVSVVYDLNRVNPSQFKDIEWPPIRELALGLYPTFSNLCIKEEQLEQKKQGGSDWHEVKVALVFFRGVLFVQAVRDIPEGATLNFSSLDGRNSQAKVEEIFDGDMVVHKCSGKACRLAFPIKAGKDSSNAVLTCPMEECGATTNIWQRMKRITEIKADHAEALKKIADGRNVEQGISVMREAAAELASLVERPNQLLAAMEDDLRNSLYLNILTKEKDWLAGN